MRFQIAILAIAAACTANAQQLILSSQDGKARLPEIVELPLTDAQKHVPDLEHKTAENTLTHKAFATQIDKDRLLIAVQLPAKGTLAIDFVPSNSVAPAEPLVFGREALERKDDFAWENKMSAYRVYGPALEATGEITSGIDVWSKRVPNFVIDSFYKRDAEGQRTHNPALSYHKDNGVGLDSYLVGPSRGCGGTGVLSGGKLWVSKNYNHLKQIANGPVRFEFELTYAPWNANGTEVTETKRITLDAGTHLNKIESTFTFSGTSTIDAVAGLAVRVPGNSEQLENGQILSVWDTPQDPGAGMIATGLMEGPGQSARAMPFEGQSLLIFPVHSGQTFTYFAGSGWSKADMPTQKAWDAYLQQTLAQIQHPLSVKWETKADGSKK